MHPRQAGTNATNRIEFLDAVPGKVGAVVNMF